MGHNRGTKLSNRSATERPPKLGRNSIRIAAQNSVRKILVFLHADEIIQRMNTACDLLGNAAPHISANSVRL
jgi:hypothetical protein